MDNTSLVGHLCMIDTGDGEYIEAPFLEEFVGNFYTKKDEHGKVLKLDIWSNDGDRLPHCHFREVTNGNRRDKIDGCFKLFKPEYFAHGSHRSTLNNKVCRLLNAYLKEESDESPGMTNWEYAVTLWYKKYGRPDYRTKEQPDYSKLNENRKKK